MKVLSGSSSPVPQLASLLRRLQRGERIGEHMQIGGAEIIVAVMMAVMAVMAVAMMIMAVAVFDSHMDSRAVTSMKPPTSRRWPEPTRTSSQDA